MSKEFSQLSISPGVSVNPDTGEIIKILTDNHTKGSQRPGNYAPSTYSQSSIDCARFVTSDLCERVISKISGGRRVKRGNNKGYDIVTNDGKKIEAKVGRIGNSAVVKENQLFDFDANYWGFIFYRTIKNLPPSYYTSLAKKISPAAELRRNISIEIAYILPTEVMRYYWNTAGVKKGIISTTGIAHRPFTYSRAEGLINNPEVPGNRIERNFQYGKHNFLVKSINFTL